MTDEILRAAGLKLRPESGEQLEGLKIIQKILSGESSPAFDPSVVNLRRSCLLAINVLSGLPKIPSESAEVLGLITSQISRFEIELTSTLLSEIAEVILVLRDLEAQGEKQQPHSLEFFAGFVSRVTRTFSQTGDNRGIMWNLVSNSDTVAAISGLFTLADLIWQDWGRLIGGAVGEKLLEACLGGTYTVQSRRLKESLERSGVLEWKSIIENSGNSGPLNVGKCKEFPGFPSADRFPTLQSVVNSQLPPTPFTRGLAKFWDESKSLGIFVDSLGVRSRCDPALLARLGKPQPGAAAVSVLSAALEDITGALSPGPLDIRDYLEICVRRKIPIDTTFVGFWTDSGSDLVSQLCTARILAGESSSLPERFIPATIVSPNPRLQGALLDAVSEICCDMNSSGQAVLASLPATLAAMFLSRKISCASCVACTDACINQLPGEDALVESLGGKYEVGYLIEAIGGKLVLRLLQAFANASLQIPSTAAEAELSVIFKRVALRAKKSEVPRKKKLRVIDSTEGHAASVFLEEHFLHVLQLIEEDYRLEPAVHSLSITLLVKSTSPIFVGNFASKTLEVGLKIPSNSHSTAMWQAFSNALPKEILYPLLPAIIEHCQTIPGISRPLELLISGSSSGSPEVANFVASELESSSERPVSVLAACMRLFKKFLVSVRGSASAAELMPRASLHSIGLNVIAIARQNSKDLEISDASAALLGELSGWIDILAIRPASPPSALPGPVNQEIAVKALALRVLNDFVAPKLKSDAHALCAQEVLSSFGSLQSEISLSLRPYLSTHYKYSGAPSPGSPTSMVVAWARESLPTSAMKKLLSACLHASNCDESLSVFLLPYVYEGIVLLGNGDAVHRAVLLDARDRLIGPKSLLTSPDLTSAQAAMKVLDHLGVSQSGRENARVILDDPPMPTLMRSAMRCADWPRALYYFQVISGASGAIAPPGQCPGSPAPPTCAWSLLPGLGVKELFQLAQIYFGLRQADSIAGVIAAYRKPPISDHKVWREIEGLWLQLSGDTEGRAGRLESGGTAQALARALVDGGKWKSALAVCLAVAEQPRESFAKRLSETPDENSTLELLKIAKEAAWKSRDWQALKKLSGDALGILSEDPIPARLLAIANSVPISNFQVARQSIAPCLWLDDSVVTKLHVLADLEWLTGGINFQDAARVLTTRAEILPPRIRIEALHAGASALVAAAQVPDQVETELVRACRKAGNLSLAKQLILRSETQFIRQNSLCLTSITLLHSQWRRVLQTAKVHFALGDFHAGRAQIERGLEIFGSGTDESWPAELKSLVTACRQNLLLPRAAVRQWRSLVARGERRTGKEKEKVFFHFAEYLDAMLLQQHDSGVVVGSARPSKNAWNLQKLSAETMRYYLQSLQHDRKRVLLTMNRVISLYSEFPGSVGPVLAELHSSIAPCVWFVGLQQLVPRLLASNGTEDTLVSEIVQRILIAHPDHAGWLVVPAIMSSNQPRRAIASKIVAAAEAVVPGKIFERFRVTIESLIGIARFGKDAGKGEQPPMTKLSDTKEGGRLFRNGKLIVPLQSQIGFEAALKNFSGSQKFIASWRDQVRELPSKARPKKLTLIDTDGREHGFLCKNDQTSDLRKDARMMEFANIVNSQVLPDEISMRTYSVVPLSEDTGLIEWINNLIPLRHALEEGVRIQGGPFKFSSMYSKEVQEALSGPQQHSVFLQLLRSAPPVLQHWYVEAFPEPAKWLEARTKFARSLAVWSMVGFTVGLGDRHCENILIDRENGEVVHVDFDCLFGKGMLLQTPEIVPFRLTQNCVAALGLTGVDGVFRNTCETVMEALRKHRKLLLSSLGAFVADPSIDWKGKGGKAVEALRVIERKLLGIVDCGCSCAAIGVGQNSEEPLLAVDERDGRSALGRDRGVGLSVEAQVDELIRAALCTRNLSKMYIGWLPML